MKTILPVTTKVENDDKLPAQRMNAVDRIVTFFSPESGVRRMVNRDTLHKFGYNDSDVARKKAPPIRGSESWVANRDRQKQMADARDAAQYDWIGGALAKVVLYVCGRLHCRSTTGDPEVDAMYDDYFHGWCGDERDEGGRTRCDLTGRHRFLKMVQMAFLAFLVDGDHGINEVEPIYEPSTGEVLREFCLQNVEADRIGSPLDATNSEYYIGGMQLDPETGRVVFFRIFRRTRTAQYVDPQEIPAESFIHVVDQDRNDEYRGRTKLLRLLNDLRDIRETIDAEKAANKTQSQWAAAFTSKDQFKGTGPSAWTGQTKEGTPTQDAIWGKILKMGEGEGISMLSPAARPSGATMALWQMLIRKMAVSLNLPYGFLWDLVTLGGVTARIEVESAHRQINYWQENVIEGLILNRVRQKVIAQGVAQNILPEHPNWKKCEWHFGPWITTDAGYEMDNDIAATAHGIMPVSKVMAKYGHTPSEVFDSNATTATEAINSGAKAGIPVETFAGGLYPNLTNQRADMIEGPPPPPPAGSIERLGDKGVAKLLELLEAVGDGTIDRESGLSTLVATFGFTRRGAEKICPQEPDEASLNRAAGLSPEGKHAPVGPKIVVSGKKPTAKKPAGKSKK